MTTKQKPTSPSLDRDFRTVPCHRYQLLIFDENPQFTAELGGQLSPL